MSKVKIAMAAESWVGVDSVLCVRFFNFLICIIFRVNNPLLFLRAEVKSG